MRRRLTELGIIFIVLEAVCLPAFAGYPASQMKIFAKEKNPHYYLAQKYIQEKNYEKARDEFTILIKDAPNDPQYRISRGQVEIRMKDFKGALADAEKVPSLTQNQFLHYLATEVKARALAGLNKTSDAISEFTQALKSQPDQPEAQLDLAKLLFKSKQYDESLARLKLAKSLYQQTTRKESPERMNEIDQLIAKIDKIQSKSKRHDKNVD